MRFVTWLLASGTLNIADSCWHTNRTFGIINGLYMAFAVSLLHNDVDIERVCRNLDAKYLA